VVIEQKRLPSAIDLTETIEELRALTGSAVLLMGQERVRLYGAVPGVLTLTDWSRLRNAVVLLRELNAGRRCSVGGDSVGRSLGGKAISQF
jgi:hypothetical protein